MGAKRLYGVVAGAAALVYAGALWNRFAFDDLFVIVANPLVHHASGVWRAFATPYWPLAFIGGLYRPLPVATYVVDWWVGQPWWFHAVNVAWHAAASVLVAALARRWAGERAGLVAGLLFAVHPVHVEAVANVVGRAELMATTFALLAVYAATVRGSVGWTAAALGAALLSKENAVAAPVLIALVWMTGVAPRPSHRAMARFGVSWALVGAAYAAARWLVLHPTHPYPSIAAAFVGQSPLTIRLTAVAALTDVARLMVWPWHLRVDYSPLERTAVLSAVDPRFLAGLLVAVLWGSLVVLAWRRRWGIGLLALAWIAIAYAPVANLLFPTGVLVAERTLYLPSAGLALAAGAIAARLELRAGAVAGAIVFGAFGVRSALRVPVWRDTRTFTFAALRDSPASFQGWVLLGDQYLRLGDHARALDALLRADSLFDRDGGALVAAADAAYAAGQRALGDSLVARADAACAGCDALFDYEATVARARGDSTSAAALAGHARALRAVPDRN